LSTRSGLSNGRVRSDFTEWRLTWMKDDVGFDGWPLDMANGYSAPFASAYINSMAPDHAFAEI
jgi:alpha-amylase